jgi:hypothetical protein
MIMCTRAARSSGTWWSSDDSDRDTTNAGVNDPVAALWATGDAGHRGRSRQRWFCDDDTGSGSDGGTKRRLTDALARSCCNRNA